MVFESVKCSSNTYVYTFAHNSSYSLCQRCSWRILFMWKMNGQQSSTIEIHIYIYIHIWMLLVFVGSACILQWNIIIHFSLGPTLSPHIHRWNFSNEWIFRWLEWNEKWRKPKEMEGKRNKNVTHNIFLKWNHYFCCHLDAFMWLHWVWNCRGTSNGHTFIRPTTTL